jgi:hypothetical protein
MFIASLVWLVMPLPHWHLVASPVVSWDLFPFSHAVKVKWRRLWLVSLAVSSCYSRNGKRVLMGTHIRMVPNWVAFLLNAREDLHLRLILVCGCCGGSFIFVHWVSAGKLLSCTPVSATSSFFHFFFPFHYWSFHSVLYHPCCWQCHLTKPQINKVCCMPRFSCMILAMTLAKPSRPW